MGPDLDAGQRPQVVVPRDVWQGARLVPGGRLALLGTTVAPGFDYADYESGERAALLARHPAAHDLIVALTREEERTAEVRAQAFPRSRLKGEANLLIMPTLDAANIAFNLLKTAAADGITIGPVLLGCAAPVHILTPSATVRRIVNMTALTVVDANAQRTLFSA